MKTLVGCAVLLAMLTGCHWRTEAEEYKAKWLEEARYHYQTQMIKSRELEEAFAAFEKLRAENEVLKAELAALRATEKK